MAAGANGLMIEIHPNPKVALSDSNQALNFDEFDILLLGIQTIRESVVSLSH